MRLARLTAAVLLGVVLSTAAYADRVDDIVKSEMAQQHVPGVALAVIKNGATIRSGGYGLANVELNVPVTPRTVFKIGSLSKQFLAAGIMLLEQEGKVNLDDSVQKYVADAPQSWSGVTLRHMLSHTGGLIREGPAFDPFKAQPDIDVIRSGYTAALVFTPSARWQYSNIGYFTLAEITARISGSPWPVFFKERIFKPLNMDATRTTTTEEIVPNRADGYVWQDGNLRRAREFTALRPSGAFLSTVEDLAKWDAALTTGAPLKKPTLDRMWTPVMLSDKSSSAYGFGWEVQTRGGKRSVHHGGSLPGFRAYYARFPDDGLSFVVLTNGDNAIPNRILWKVAAEWLPGVDAGPPNGRREN